MDQPKLRVLVVDDDAGRSDRTIRVLRSASVPLDITVVADATGWQQALKAFTCDLIISERHLPWIDALETVRAVKSRWPHCPILIYTDVNDAEKAVALLKAGADDYIIRSSEDAIARLHAGLTATEPHPTANQLGLKELSVLYETSRTINANTDLKAMVRTVLAQASELLGARMAALQLMRPDEKKLELVGTYWSDQADDQDSQLLGTKIGIGEGLTGQVALTGQPMAVSDYQQWPERVPAYEQFGVRRVLGVPLRRGGEVIGVLNIADDRGTNPFSEAEIRLASLFADQVAVGITNAQLLENERRRNEELETLRAASLQLTSSLELQPVLTAILEQALKIVRADDAHIFLYDGHKLTYGAALWADGRERPPYTPRPHGITATVARSGKRIVVSDTDQHPLFQDWRWGGAIVGMPLRIGQRVRGVMNIAYTRPYNFSENDLRLLDLLADQAAIAIQNAQLYDQTQRHAMELEEEIAARTAELQAANEQLRRLNRVRSEFVSNVSHEFRTPLANIMLLARLLGIVGEDERDEILSTLQRETESLAALIEDLLDLSRLDLERAKLEFSWVDVNALITNLVADRVGLVTERGLSLQSQPHPGLPLVWADPKRLLQVFTNLLTNAMNYTPSGGQITVRTGHDARDDKDYVTVDICDTGIGIPDDELPHIFERFYRGVSARKSDVSGTGLGLAICQELIQRHRGEITVQSQAGVGSQFRVWLPVPTASPASAR